MSNGEELRSGLARIVIINLKKSIRRRAACESKLAAFGLEAEFFEACDGASAEPHGFDYVDDRAFTVNTGRHVKAGEIACFASHKTLWQRCVQDQTPLLIMEDDFQLAPQFPEALAAAAELVHEHGFIRLQSETRARSRVVRSFGKFRLSLYSKVPHSMMCYALSPTAAEGLLAHSNTLSAPVDVFVKQFWLHRQAIYGLQPYTVTESELSSDSRIGFREKAERGLTLRILRQINRFLGALRGMIYSRSLHRTAYSKMAEPRAHATDTTVVAQTELQ